MNHTTANSPPRFFVSADWSKDPRKRSVYVADLSERLIYREARSDWALPSLMALARHLSERGSVLVGVDLVLGVPQSYWELVLAESRHDRPATFIDWLEQLGNDGGFFDPAHTVRNHGQWRVDRPWFLVPPGAGSLTSFKAMVYDGFLRGIDRATGAKPLFIVSGIPGTVGSGTRDFWRELTPHLSGHRDFRIWPFDGPLSELLERGIVLTETYPGLAYAAALAERLPTERTNVAKTKQEQRTRACNLLAQAAWVTAFDVDIGDLQNARQTEDDFDALFTAAAVLRCYLESTPVVDPDWIDATAEGSMLLAGPVDPSRKSKALLGTAPTQVILNLAPTSIPKKVGDSRRPRQSRAARRTEYPCPVPGCAKVFSGSRSGWDAHIEYLHIHPNWYPEVSDRKERKALFRRQHADWFR